VDCNDTGYRGRCGLYEVMAISNSLREMIIERRPSSDLKQQAMKEGMLTLRADGLEEVQEGPYFVGRNTQGDKRLLEGEVSMFNLRDLLHEMIEKRASDLHITAGLPPQLRVDGHIVSTTHDKLTPRTLSRSRTAF